MIVSESLNGNSYISPIRFTLFTATSRAISHLAPARKQSKLQIIPKRRNIQPQHIYMFKVMGYKDLICYFDLCFPFLMTVEEVLVLCSCLKKESIKLACKWMWMLRDDRDKATTKYEASSVLSALEKLFDCRHHFYCHVDDLCSGLLLFQLYIICQWFYFQLFLFCFLFFH